MAKSNKLGINRSNLFMFRIKTYEEFGYRTPSGWNTSGLMDYLYGRSMKTLSISSIDEYRIRIHREGTNPSQLSVWSLCYDDLTLITNSNEEFE